MSLAQPSSFSVKSLNGDSKRKSEDQYQALLETIATVVKESLATIELVRTLVVHTGGNAMPPQAIRLQKAVDRLKEIVRS